MASLFLFFVLFICFAQSDNTQLVTSAPKNKTQCEYDFDHYFHDLSQLKPWALQMFDASTKMQPGLLTGNLLDLGNYDECVGIEQIQLTPKKHIIQGQYCQLKVNISLDDLKGSNKLYNSLVARDLFLSKNLERVLADVSGIPGPLLSICVPHTCSPNETKAYLINKVDNPLLQIILKPLGITHDKLEHLLYFDQNACQTMHSEEWTAIDIVTISIVSIVAFLCFFSTIYDIYMQYNEIPNPNRVFTAFSIYTNGRKLLSTSKNSDQLGCLNGIRFISMMWVVLGHKFNSSAVAPYINYIDVSNWINNLENMYVIGAPVSVDTFFVLSGLLVSYVTLNAMSKGTKFNIPMFYLHRYLRLTPALGVVILFNVSTVHLLGSGPYWSTGLNFMKSTCKDYWWSVLLYVQTYVNPEQICIPQSWYLSVDMQLFILSPLLILSAWYLNPWINNIINGIIIFFSMLSPFLVTYINKFPGNPISMNNNDYQTKYYYPLHTRFGPWVIGFVLGYYLYRIKTRRTNPLTLTKISAIAGWVFWICIMITVVWAPYNFGQHPYNRWESSTYYLFFRNVWSAGICWVIYACVQGYGGVVNWFLSASLFQVLGRLTYSMYLIHATLQMMQLISVRTTAYFTDYIILHDFWGDLIYTMALSVLLTLMFESPMITIEKIIFGGGSKVKSTSDLRTDINNKDTPTQVMTHKD